MRYDPYIRILLGALSQHHWREELGGIGGEWVLAKSQS